MVGSAREALGCRDPRHSHMGLSNYLWRGIPSQVHRGKMLGTEEEDKGVFQNMWPTPQIAMH
jgi:hypothetical protein